VLCSKIRCCGYIHEAEGHVQTYSNISVTFCF
jgi:hypothetical protein